MAPNDGCPPRSPISQLTSSEKFRLINLSDKDKHNSNHNSDDDELFWISYDDLCRLFQVVTVCMIKKQVPNVTSISTASQTISRSPLLSTL